MKRPLFALTALAMFVSPFAAISAAHADDDNGTIKSGPIVICNGTNCGEKYDPLHPRNPSPPPPPPQQLNTPPMGPTDPCTFRYCPPPTGPIVTGPTFPDPDPTPKMPRRRL